MDFNDLAARMSAGVAGVRACLILTRDGLSLGAHPADAEPRARHAWDALQRIGDPQRGFVDMGTEIWVVATGGAYGAAMVATPEAKPGLLLDLMESQLLAAEESRSVEPPEPVMATKVVDLSTAVSHTNPPPVTPEERPLSPTLPAPAGSKNVDRVALAREFSRLLDADPHGDD